MISYDWGIVVIVYGHRRYFSREREWERRRIMIRNIVDENKCSELKGNEKNIKLLNILFRDIELSVEEERGLIWLSTWEVSTVKNIVAAFSKVK